MYRFDVNNKINLKLKNWKYSGYRDMCMWKTYVWETIFSGFLYIIIK